MEVLPVLKHALMITAFVFVMMLVVDFADAATQRRVSALIKGGPWRQYAVASFLGATPGCLGAFMNVSLYVHGLIGFGAIVGGMIATSGDEAFVMLALFPETALWLFAWLFVLGTLFAWVTDKIAAPLGIVPGESCFEHRCEQCLPNDGSRRGAGVVSSIRGISDNFRPLSFARFLLIMCTGFFFTMVILGRIDPGPWDWVRVTFGALCLCTLFVFTLASEHYLHDHVWQHIIKQHLFRVFLWSFGALLFVHWGLALWDLEVFVRGHRMWLLLIAGLLGVIPESGPHLIFVMMYSQGLVPFSVLFTSSFVQDGHGMLPLLSYSVRDSILVKSFNVAFGLAGGGILFAFGL